MNPLPPPISEPREVSSQTRVLVVSPCQGMYGGMEAFVMAVADSLAKRPEFSVRIVWKMVRKFQLDPVFEGIVSGAGIRSVFVPRMSGELWRQITWSDVVHCQNAPPDVISMALVLRRPVALTIHNWNRRSNSFGRRLF